MGLESLGIETPEEPRQAISKLRNRILKRKGIATAPYTKRFIDPADRPDFFPKTDRMRLLERKYHIKMEDVLFKGSLSDVVRTLHWEVDRSTVSKWRKSVIDKGIRTG